MPGQHARLSPSGSHRWLKCAGSITLESQFPDKSNEFSDSGTAMHWVASSCLTAKMSNGEPFYATAFIGQPITVNDFEHGEPHRHVVFTQEHAEIVQGYVDTVRALAAGHELHVEQRVEFSEFVGVPDQFGTADAIILRTDGEMCVIDLKTGFRFVPVEHNTQLMLYALGAYRMFELSHAPTSVRLMIYQPQHGGMREWVVSLSDLMAFAAVAHAAAQKVEEAALTFGDWEQPRATRNWPLMKMQDEWERTYLHPDPNEDDCSFCRAMSTCPAKRAKLERVVGASFDVIAEESIVANGAVLDLHDVPQDQLSRAMKCAGEFEDWIKAVRAEVERRLLLGIPVEGFGLELGREGARAWTDEETVTKYMRESMRLPVEKAFDMKLISPTTAEKLAGFKQGKKIAKPKTAPIIGAKQWAKLQPLIKRSPPSPSVKPADKIQIPYNPTGPSADAFDAVDEQPEDLT